MKETKIYLVTGNEDLRNRNLFIENLLYQKALMGEKPLLIDLVVNNRCFIEEAIKEKNNTKNNDIFDYYTDMAIPSIPFEKLYSILKGKKSQEVIGRENDFSCIVMFGELLSELTYLYQCVDHIVLVVKNDYETSNYLYGFINKLYDKMIDKNINIVVSGIKRIEDAAMLFCKLRDEMKEMIDSTLVFDFLGFFDFDVKKISFIKRKRITYIKIFFEDDFHGNIKFINEKMEGLEYLKVSPLFKSIAEK
ncbi:MAG: hypothetical protein JW881_10270 [Spirochaetales bacterium]|nr:hypothetical protein [Spirochaetales bacterium]